MMTDAELRALIAENESDRVELTISLTDTDKFSEAVCAFANDLPGHNLPGVLMIGLNNDGSCGNINVTNWLLQNLGALRSDGNIVPLPDITVEKRRLDDCELAVVTVQPSYDTPVRFKGRVWIRVGPRRAIASPEEERRLTEKRRSRDVPFDLKPIRSARIENLNLEFFRNSYLPLAVAPEVLEQNRRSVEDQLLSLRFLSRDRDTQELFPTITGIIATGQEPRDYMPGAYVQFIRFAGRELTDPIQDQKEIGGPLYALIREMDEVFKANISVETDFKSGTVERQRPNYPMVALQQISRSAILHRNYEGTNAPVRISWFDDRIEILSPGGPFGQVSVETFGKPGVTDYRNAHIAEVMQTLGFVQRFGVGIATAREALRANGNPSLEFDVKPNNVLAVLKRV